LAPQTDATFYDELGVDKVLLSGHLSIEATVVGTMTRTPGAVGTAHLVFADDASALEYSYTEAPPVDYVGVSLAILVPAGVTSGRVVETAAVGGGYFRVEVIGDDLRVEISDGVAAPIGISRALPARDEVFGFTAALGSGGLFLALSGDTAGNVVNASRAGYDAPIAETLRIGGAGAHLYGGQLASPADFTAAEAATAAADVMATYGPPSALIDTDFGSDFATLYPDVNTNIAVYAATLSRRPTQAWGSLTTSAGGVVANKTDQYPNIKIPLHHLPGMNGSFPAGNYRIRVECSIGLNENGGVNNWTRDDDGNSISIRPEEGLSYSQVTFNRNLAGTPKLEVHDEIVTVSASGQCWVVLANRSNTGLTGGGDPIISSLLVEVI
jgi:hypothetical protein